MTSAARTLLLAAALTLAACGDPPEDGGAADGSALFVQGNCTTCHGRDGAGSQLGPPLRGLAEHWDRDSLAAYLADPKGTIEGNERLLAQGRKYRMPMPALTWPLDQRLELADHVLSFPAAAE